jgi:hypothetical protein
MNDTASDFNTCSDCRRGQESGRNGHDASFNICPDLQGCSSSNKVFAGEIGGPEYKVGQDVILEDCGEELWGSGDSCKELRASFLQSCKGGIFSWLYGIEIYR